MLDNLTKNQKLGLAAVGGGVLIYLLWPKKAKAAPKTTTKPTTTTKPVVKQPVTPEVKKDTTINLQPDSYYKDVNGVEWKITQNNKYADGTSLPSGNAFVRAVVFNDQSLDGAYASVWNSRYAEGYGSGIINSGPISAYPYLKSQAIAKINSIAEMAKAEVSAYKSASSSKGSASEEEEYTDTQTERVSGMKWHNSYTKPLIGATSHPYFYGTHGAGAVKNPYYYGSVHGYYPSPSYAPLTEQRPRGIMKPHGAVGATNVGPIDIDPFYVEKITLKKRR